MDFEENQDIFERGVGSFGMFFITVFSSSLKVSENTKEAFWLVYSLVFEVAATEFFFLSSLGQRSSAASRYLQLLPKLSLIKFLSSKLAFFSFYPSSGPKLELMLRME